MSSKSQPDYFCLQYKDRGPVNVETDLELTKTSLRSHNVKKFFFEKLFLKSSQPLAVHSNY